MTPDQFIAKWQAATLSERSACQQHFLDLCELLGHAKPAEVDPEGTWYCFEKGVQKTAGGSGWADVWMRDHFGWEYKGKHKDLKAAYNQLLQYREDLENPPLLVVCDLDRFEIHTNFTGTAKRVYALFLEGLSRPENLTTLRLLFTYEGSYRFARLHAPCSSDQSDIPKRSARAIPADEGASFGPRLERDFVRALSAKKTVGSTVGIDRADNCGGAKSTHVRELPS